MGTQQILLIVLSVIIVGVAIVVGIGMFNRQAYNSNKTAIAADAQQFASEVVKYYKTPLSQGGAMGEDGVDATAFSVANIASYVGIGAEGDTPTYVSNENGEYWVDSATTTSVVIKSFGKSKRGDNYPNATTTITFPEGSISTTSGDSAGKTF